MHMLCLCVLPCACPPLSRLANLPEVAGCEAKLRMEGDKPYVTDNSNYIVDLYFQVSLQPRGSLGDGDAATAANQQYYGLSQLS